MFENFSNNLLKNLNRTKELLSRNLNKETLSQKYFKFLKDPKIQKITGVNPDEYNQKINLLKQVHNNKKKGIRAIIEPIKEKKTTRNNKRSFYK